MSYISYAKRFREFLKENGYSNRKVSIDDNNYYTTVTIKKIDVDPTEIKKLCDQFRDKSVHYSYTYDLTKEIIDKYRDQLTEFASTIDITYNRCFTIPNSGYMISIRDSGSSQLSDIRGYHVSNIRSPKYLEAFIADVSMYLHEESFLSESLEERKAQVQREREEANKRYEEEQKRRKKEHEKYMKEQEKMYQQLSFVSMKKELETKIVTGVKFPKLNKNNTLNEYIQELDNGYNQNDCIITHTVNMSRKQYELFTNNLLSSFIWLKDKHISSEYCCCVHVVCQETNENLYVHTSGYDYARYVGLK